MNIKKIVQYLVVSIAVSLDGYSFAATLVAPVLIAPTFVPALSTGGTVTSVTGSSPTSGVAVTVTNGTTTPNVAVALTNLGVSSVNATSSVVAASFSGAGTGLTGTAASLTVGNATAASSLTGTPSIAVSGITASGLASLNGGLAVSGVPTVSVAGTSYHTSFTLSQLSVSIGIAPTGTFVGSSTGAFTSGTALPAPWGASPFYGLYLYYPANAIGSGVPAGLYWTRCTSTTACQVYNAAYTSGQPAIPASPTAFSGQTGAVSTAPTTTVTLDSMSLPAGTLGNFGVVTDVAYWAVNSSASSKTIYFNFDGSTVLHGSVTTVTAVQAMTGKVSNAGSTAAQIWVDGAFAGSSGNSSFSSHSLNTATTAAVITHACTLALATDFCIIAQDVETVTP